VIQLLIRCFLPSFCVPALSFEQAHRQPNDTVRDDAARRPEGVRPRHEDPFGDTDTLLNPQASRRDVIDGNSLPNPQASRRDVIGGNNTPHLQEPRHDGGTGGDTLPTPQASRRYVTLGDLPNLLASHRNDTGGNNIPHLQEPRHDDTGGDTLPNPQASRRDDTGGDNLPQDLPLGCVPCLFATRAYPCCRHDPGGNNLFGSIFSSDDPDKMIEETCKAAAASGGD